MIAKKRFLEGIFPEMTKKIKQEELEAAMEELYSGTGAGSDFTGWLYWPREFYVSEEYRLLKETAKEICKKNEAVVVVGIGGSYLTPQMLINSEYGNFYNEVATGKEVPRMYFLGNDLSPVKFKQTLDLLSNVDCSVIYVSKSGGTMEPAIAFRTLWEVLKKKYGNHAYKRVYSITDPQSGVLRDLTKKLGFESFEIPKNIGGRYSGLTACGLLPCAVAGIDTDELLKGAINAIREQSNVDSFAMKYAKWRYENYLEGRKVEFYAANDPYLSYVGEWLKQLFGESEGKDSRGIFPASGIFPTDLHSLGQYLQEGSRNLVFETFLERKFRSDIEIPKSDLRDNLGSKEGKKLSQAAMAAMDGAYQAHSSGGNPCGIIRLENGIETMGYFMQSMFISCAIYCYMLGVNPFNQPGVEQHKAAMKSSPAWEK